MFTVIETRKQGLAVYAVFHGQTLLTTTLSETAAIAYVRGLEAKLKRVANGVYNV